MNEMNLADVLENYAAATGAENDQRILHEWMGKYPQHAAALMDFAAARLRSLRARCEIERRRRNALSGNRAAKFTLRFG